MNEQIKFIGVGSAFAKKNYNSSFIIEKNNKRLLVDCGRTVPEALLEAGFKWHDIDAVYISHAHSDHIGGLEEFAFARYFIPPKSRPMLLAHKSLKDKLWNNSLKGGLCLSTNPMGYIEERDIQDYFDASFLEDFLWNDVDFLLIEHKHIMPSYGLRINFGNKIVLFSSDCIFESVNNNISHYNDANLIFQDCEIAPYKSKVHAHFDELKTLSDDIRNKMWLYHYQDVGNDIDLQQKAHEAGFAGFIKQGQVFT